MSQEIAQNSHHPSSYWRLMKRVLKRFTRKALGWVLIALGFVLVFAGFVAVIIPGHMFLIVVGLMLILRNAFWARRQFIHLKRRHPKWIMPIRKLLRKRPQFVSVFWQQALRVERLVLRSGHVLGGLRRRFFRRARTA